MPSSSVPWSSAHPAIQLAYAVTGGADYLLKVVVADLHGLSALVNEVLLPHPSVAEVRSLVGLERLKDGSALPLSISEREKRAACAAMALPLYPGASSARRAWNGHARPRRMTYRRQKCPS